MFRYAILICCLLGGLALATDVRTSAPSPSLANIYQGGVDLRRYWVSEKVDGVRALWDAEAIVVALLPGKGKYRDMLGSLLVEAPRLTCFGSGLTAASLGSHSGSFRPHRSPKVTARASSRFAGLRFAPLV